MNRLKSIFEFWLSFLFCLGGALGIIGYLMLSIFFWVMGYGFGLNLVKH